MTRETKTCRGSNEGGNTLARWPQSAPILNSIGEAPRGIKQLLQASCDAFTLFFVSFAIPWLLGAPIRILPFITDQQIFVAIYVPLGMAILWLSQFYRVVLRRLDRSFVEQLVHAGLALSVLAAAIFFDRTSMIKAIALGLVTGCMSIGLIALGRLVALSLLNRGTAGGLAEPIIIYGAGQAGHALADSLQDDPRFSPVAFVDDDPTLRRLRVGALTVHSSREIEALRDRFATNRIALAIPSLTRKRRREIMEHLVDLGFDVLSVPAFSDLMSGSLEVTDLRKVNVTELLERDVVDLSRSRVHRWFEGRTVMITGAGGTIGAEVARQIARLRVARVVLFENSEAALYAIHQELAVEPTGPEIVPVLGSVTDRSRLNAVFARFEVDALFHAAAFKHVPMVEENALAGIDNNVLGTEAVAEAAGEAGVKRVILVSTDKAVRPTSIMGATKRLAELSISAAQERHRGTIFSLVRFGNVLGSSGSVVPLFERQIMSGGPVTVTHPDIIRYFMTIPEAAQLVITAGLQANGGEVFVLDMGEPVRILDLARRMIGLSGATVKDRANPDGEIEIRFTGLRPGEKLFEELLIDGNTVETPHPKIFCAHEGHLPDASLAPLIGRLRAAVAAGDLDAAIGVLAEAVPGFAPSAHAGDIASRGPDHGRGQKFSKPRVIPGGLS
ncbi:polysaccharide biosynthesis protein [Rhodobacteraceae bacterium NNCM2]|nr:polysaccharide biosynthesis protein [Coraliihabitans acroporae]